MRRVPRSYTPAMRLWGKGDSAEAVGRLPLPTRWDLAEQARYCHRFVERYHRSLSAPRVRLKGNEACDTVGITGFFDGIFQRSWNS